MRTYPSKRVEEKETDQQFEIAEVTRIFIHNLKLLRSADGTTGVELSERLKMSKHRINDLENGKMPPTFSDLILIVDYFPITFDDLLEGLITLDIKSRRA